MRDAFGAFGRGALVLSTCDMGSVSASDNTQDSAGIRLYTWLAGTM